VVAVLRFTVELALASESVAALAVVVLHQPFTVVATRAVMPVAVRPADIVAVFSADAEALDVLVAVAAMAAN